MAVAGRAGAVWELRVPVIERLTTEIISIHIITNGLTTEIISIIINTPL